MKTVAVLGASYGGAHAARVLARGLPEDWRVVLIDRNSHLNHLYVLPRYAVVPGHEHKAFVPYSNAFGPLTEQTKRHVFLHAVVTSLFPHSLTLSRAFPEHGIEGPVPTLSFDYLIYALGSHLPAPINLWGPVDGGHWGEQLREPAGEATCIEQEPPIIRGTKAGGIAWLQQFRRQVARASSVLVVGGGALGIQYATDIAEVFPTKQITLLHSRAKLLPRFDEGMHDEILSTLAEMNIATVLGDRLDLSHPAKTVVRPDGTTERVVRTESGREISAGMLLLCTGQTPNTSLMQALLPDSIVPDGPSKGMIRVKRSLQVGTPTPPHSRLSDTAKCQAMLSQLSLVNDDSGEDEDEGLTVPHPHIFAIGDSADAFGAINAGHNAYFQGEVAARNIIRLVQSSLQVNGSATNSQENIELERYAPGPPGIKISLGLTKSLFQVDGVVGKKSDVPEDLDAGALWKMYGIDADEAQMYL